MRGGSLERRQVVRLLKRPDLRVLHVYGPEPVETDGASAQLVASLTAFYDGEAGPFAGFRVADFRDDARRVLLVVEQSC